MKARTAINQHLSARRLPARFSAAASAKREREMEQTIARQAAQALAAAAKLRKKDAYWESIKAEAARIEDLLHRTTERVMSLADYQLYPETLPKAASIWRMQGEVSLCINFSARAMRMRPCGDRDAYLDLLATRFARDVYQHAKKTLKLVDAYA